MLIRYLLLIVFTGQITEVCLCCCTLKGETFAETKFLSFTVLGPFREIFQNTSPAKVNSCESSKNKAKMYLVILFAIYCKLFRLFLSFICSDGNIQVPSANSFNFGHPQKLILTKCGNFMVRLKCETFFQRKFLSLKEIRNSYFEFTTYVNKPLFSVIKYNSRPYELCKTSIVLRQMSTV